MSHCDEALAKLGKAIMTYQQNHDGQNPENLKNLIGLEGITAWDLVCPASKYGVGDCSYVYRGSDLDQNADPDMVIAYDKDPVHKGRRNLLFADGRVERFPEKIFDKHLRNDNQLRLQHDLSER